MKYWIRYRNNQDKLHYFDADTPRGAFDYFMFHSEYAIDYGPVEGLGEKHDSAEEPSELYWNEVTGIGSMSDVYEIDRLLTLVEELKQENKDDNIST